MFQLESMRFRAGNTISNRRITKMMSGQFIVSRSPPSLIAFQFVGNIMQLIMLIDVLQFFFHCIVYVSSKPSMSDMLKICSVKNFQNISRLLIYIVLKSSFS